MGNYNKNICNLVFFVSFSGIASNLSAQNIVPNPSFEIFGKCPKDYNVNYKKTIVPDWYMPTGGTADYFNSCTKIQVGVPQNFMGNCFAKDGNAYVGLILMLEPPADTAKPAKINYREYIEAKLKEPLAKSQWYVVKFYFSISTYSTFAINRLGAFLSEKKISNTLLNGILPCKPQIYMDTARIITEKDDWFEIADTIQAKGNEQYITIGNFYNDKKTSYKTLGLDGISRVQQARIKENQMAYYFIDMVSVIKIVK